MLQILSTRWRVYSRPSVSAVWVCLIIATDSSNASSIAPEPLLLFNHFFAVAFYSIWVMFTHPRAVVDGACASGKPTMRTPTFDEYPGLLIKSVQVVCLHYLSFVY